MATDPQRPATTDDGSLDRQRRFDHRIAVAATLALCLVLLLPAPPSDGASASWIEWPAGTDKWVHALLFAAETRWLERAFRHHLPSRPALASAAAASLALGLATEALQGWVPTRQGDLYDFVADAVGVAIAALAIGIRRSL